MAVNVAGYTVHAPISREDLQRVYLPLLNLLQSELGDKKRTVAGLAGIPGSGKSTLVAVLARLADALLGMGRLAVVGMDGWHWPNAVLDKRTTTDQAGNAVPLRRRKGGPESFDVDAIARAVGDLLHANRPVSLPVYDRRLHEPLPDKIHVGPGTTIVLLEGNFVLESAQPWGKVSAQLQPKFFLAGDLDIARERVVQRHIRGGVSPEQAAEKYESNDRINAEAVLASARNADYHIRLGPEGGVYAS